MPVYAGVPFTIIVYRYSFMKDLSQIVCFHGRLLRTYCLRTYLKEKGETATHENRFYRA